MNRASKKLLGMPVYSVREGQNLGIVKTLVMDPGEKALIALVIERRRMTREERIIPFIHIQSIGDDVIIVEKASNAERKANLPQIIHHMRTPLHILGARVFTISGKILGKVEEFYFDCESGKITLLEVGGTTGAIFKEKVCIDGKYIVTMATATIMMDDKALENMEKIENPLMNTMGQAKEKATNIINETINTSKKISRNISDSWEKLNHNGDDKTRHELEEKSPADNEEQDKNDAIPIEEKISIEEPEIIVELDNPEQPEASKDANIENKEADIEDEKEPVKKETEKEEAPKKHDENAEDEEVPKKQNINTGNEDKS